MRCNCALAWRGALRRGFSSSQASRSSTSCEACQKNMYGLMVVPKMATMAVT